MTGRSVASLLAWLGFVSAAGAQALPAHPLAFADGRVIVSGDASASVGTDDTGFFNYTDYEHSTLRLLQFDLMASARAGAHFTLLGELRADNAGVRLYALYLRIRPWDSRRFDIQVGLIPPTFGAFARRSYVSDNPLIGYPLGYQYLTSLRPDSLPANADELLAMRGRGWLSSFSIGDQAPAHGVPLMSAFSWDTGAQIHGQHGWLEGAAAITTGTLANPLSFRDDNAGLQVAGRVAARPVVGLIVGASAARGPFVSSSAAQAASGAGHEQDYTQAAWGADAEYSRGHYVVRFETLFSEWTLPAIRAPLISAPLRALSTSAEGRYRIAPGVYAAARVDHLGFSEIVGSARTDTWDAPLTRVEVGGGYSILRNLLVKVSVQHNDRDGGRVPSLSLGAAQIVFWF